MTNILQFHRSGTSINRFSRAFGRSLLPAMISLLLFAVTAPALSNSPPPSLSPSPSQNPEVKADILLTPVPRPNNNSITFSRLIVYDIRGKSGNETAIIIEQRGPKVKIWFRNYLGRRTGRIPPEEYWSCFEDMRKIREFALKNKYRGRLLRTHAAQGTITLAWKENGEKKIHTIRYYAPEHTLDDFRSAFNRIWALSRYAILSRNSFESPKVEYLEDAVYFLSGTGWMTLKEIRDVVRFHGQRGLGKRIARAVWKALDQTYPLSSEFTQKNYLEYCVKKGMLQVGAPAAEFLRSRINRLYGSRRQLALGILQELENKHIITPTPAP
ncbi:hypothetical protein KAR10_08565 [bacterium]|nr:hypothetical protein [bacterium]